ncbi:hypothetical protein KCP70_10970 [Salmonella enterica subsp. enterica]|nr:hypothetical protein KCP70_10970 [Salmonella enterica subsp. enterica]
MNNHIAPLATQPRKSSSAAASTINGRWLACFTCTKSSITQHAAPCTQWCDLHRVARRWHWVMLSVASGRQIARPALPLHRPPPDEWRW